MPKNTSLSPDGETASKHWSTKVIPPSSRASAPSVDEEIITPGAAAALIPRNPQAQLATVAPPRAATGHTTAPGNRPREEHQSGIGGPHMAFYASSTTIHRSPNGAPRGAFTEAYGADGRAKVRKGKLGEDGEWEELPTGPAPAWEEVERGMEEYWRRMWGMGMVGGPFGLLARPHAGLMPWAGGLFDDPFFFPSSPPRPMRYHQGESLPRRDIENRERGGSQRLILSSEEKEKEKEKRKGKERARMGE